MAPYSTVLYLVSGRLVLVLVLHSKGLPSRARAAELPLCRAAESCADVPTADRSGQVTGQVSGVTDRYQVV